MIHGEREHATGAGPTARFLAHLRFWFAKHVARCPLKQSSCCSTRPPCAPWGRVGGACLPYPDPLDIHKGSIYVLKFLIHCFLVPSIPRFSKRLKLELSWSNLSSLVTVESVEIFISSSSYSSCKHTRKHTRIISVLTATLATWLLYYLFLGCHHCPFVPSPIFPCCCSIRSPQVTSFGWVPYYILCDDLMDACKQSRSPRPVKAKEAESSEGSQEEKGCW